MAKLLSAKRKYASITPDALPETRRPATQQKPGKLKSILKRPSPPSRFLASTPSAQIKLEFQAATGGPGGDSLIQEDRTNPFTTAPATVKKPKLELISGADDKGSISSHPISSAAINHVLVQNSAGETDLFVPPPTKSKSPQYEDDGDTENLVTDSQPQTIHSDETLLMSGGLGPGESPYKGSAKAATISKFEPSPRKGSQRESEERKPYADLTVMDVLSSQPTLGQGTAKAQREPLVTEAEQQHRERNVAAKCEAREFRSFLGIDKTNEPTAKQETCDGLEFKLGLDSPTVFSESLEPGQRKVEPSDIRNISPAGHSVRLRDDPFVPACSNTSRSERRKANHGQSPVLADVSKILQEYEARRETEFTDLQVELRTAQARAAQLEMQLSMLHREYTAQSRARNLQHSWNLNKYVIFSRRTYSLHGPEETKVVGGCGELQEANKIAFVMFKEEMDKLESVVEDLGQVNTFRDLETGTPKIEMRSTPCGMLKCRSYHHDSRWDLMVERVAAG